MNLTELLEQSASQWPEKWAVIEAEKTLSYSQLTELVSVMAAELRTLRLPLGARVGLCLPNSADYVALTFALWRIGAVVVPLPVECAPEEGAGIARAMQLEAVLSRQARPSSAPWREGVFLTRLTPAIRADSHGLNLAFIRFTSGTTNARKGVALCHETIRDRVEAANQALRIGPEDTVMWSLPMAHHFLATIVLYLSRGATIVLARHVLPGPFLEAANRRHGTVLYGAPFHFSMLARHRAEARLDSVRLAVSTTCGLPRETALGFQERFGLPLSQAYGVIELGLACVNVDDPAGRWNSVGRPLSRYALRIAEADENGFGEVEVAGPGFFDAYADPWTAREQWMPDGWFATGDIGRLDKQGYLFLAGRATAVINLGGRKVFPEEIESALNEHPSVRESRVYGRAHPHLGEVVEAEVVLRENLGAEALRDFCRTRMSADKVPSQFHIVKDIARTAVTGKIRRPALAPAA